MICRLLLFPTIYVMAGCAEPDRTVYAADTVLLAQRAEYEQMAPPHQVQIASDDEPGRRLIVLGTLIQSETGQPVTRHSIEFYHADSAGSYGARGELGARLNGMVLTDSMGRFLISTILPTGYGEGSQILGSGHIHMSVMGAHPDAYDFFFLQGMGRGLLRWANGTDQAVVLDLKMAEGDTLLASGELTVRGLPSSW